MAMEIRPNETIETIAAQLSYPRLSSCSGSSTLWGLEIEIGLLLNYRRYPQEAPVSFKYIIFNGKVPFERGITRGSGGSTDRRVVEKV